MKPIFVLMFSFITLTACTESAATPDTLNQLFDAQDRATAAARDVQRASSQATTIAQATREFLILQGQQTRITMDNAATATAQSLNVQATQTAQSLNATRQSQSASATQTAQAVHATATAQAAEYTATANAVIVQATQASASATATADAANASATRVNAAAIATMSAEQVKTRTEQENWARMTEWAWSVFRISAMALITLVLIAIAALAFEVWRFRRRREFRDANGEHVLLLPGADGQVQVVRPGRMPGAVAQLTPPSAQPYQIESGAVDPDTTRRDQAVSLVMATKEASGQDAAKAIVEEIVEASEPEPVPATPPQIQIGKPFEPRPLLLDRAPSRLALPIGTTQTGEGMWIPLPRVTHALVGGPSRMGKTNLLHGWIQSLHSHDSDTVDLALYDGKEGMEFSRYATAPRTTIVPDALAPFLADVLVEMKRRFDLMRAAGVTNVEDYNRGRDTDERLPHQVLVVDELFDALKDDAAASALESISARAGACGIHLIMATQLPDAGSVPKHLRINALLRVAFACPSPQNSIAILGYSGAEKIEKVPGRLLIFWEGRKIEAQAFRATLPPALSASRQIADGQSASPFDHCGASPLDDETFQMVEWAVRQGRGWFVVVRVAEALGIRLGRVNRTAQILERQGLLTPVVKDANGQNLGRQVSPRLIEMVGA